MRMHMPHECDRNRAIAGSNESGGVGGRLRTARRSSGLTQKQLAEALGVEPITVSRWERGVTTPSLPRLRRIAEITETTVSDLVRAPDAATGHAVELAALREELAETRELVDRVARALERLAPPRSDASSLQASRES
jgi:transcriptional regulator with XRE-family HTH domain